MGRLFGTDGIRGIANRDLSIRRAEEVGMALAEVIGESTPKNAPPWSSAGIPGFPERCCRRPWRAA